MLRLSRTAWGLLGLLAVSTAAQSQDEVSPVRGDCEIWQEEIVLEPAGKWHRSEITAHRSAPTRLPKAVVEEREAVLVKSKRRKVKVVTSPSQPGAHNMYNTRTTFEATFRKLPCNS